MRTLRAKVGVVAPCVVIAATGLVACGSGGDTPSDFCKSVASLDSAVTQINQDPLAKSTLPAVNESLKEIDSAVKNLSESADPDFSTEVDAVEAGAEELDKSVTAATENPTPDTVNAVRVSMRALTASVGDLSKSASDSC